MTTFLLISRNRQNVYTDKRAELDYEVNVRSYRKLKELQETLDALTQRLGALEEKQGRWAVGKTSEDFRRALR